MNTPQTINHYGRSFNVLAVFPEHDVDKANAYMLANPGASLLCIRDGLAYLAHDDDEGQPLV